MSAFRINTPLASTNSLRLFSQSQAKMESAIQRLSSGLRINSAKDDSAGQAISQRMQNQVRGQKMAGANIKQGVNLIRTAEGGLDEIQSILSRMRELVVQSASDNLNTNDRDSINLEYQQLKAEVDRIANSTSYNQMNLLDGSRGGSHGLGGTQNLLATEGFIKRINVANEGAQANNNSEYSSISSDGRYITFESHATNLVDNDTNGTSDIFVHDRQMGTTERVSLASDGAQTNHHSYKPSISGDGRYIALNRMLTT